MFIAYPRTAYPYTEKMEVMDGKHSLGWDDVIMWWGENRREMDVGHGIALRKERGEA